MSSTNELGQPIGHPVHFATPIEPPQQAPMEGTFCRLVPLDAAAHADQLHEAYTDVVDIGDWTYLPYGPFGSATAYRTFLETFENQTDPMFFSIIDMTTGHTTGLASFLRIDPKSASIEVGHIHFSRRLQGTPAATEAMYLLMQRVFESGYRRYEWKCDNLNAPSRGAAARLGFEFEGVFRQAAHYKGRSRDTAWFSIIDTEWPALQTEFERWLAPANFDADGAQLSSLKNRHS